MNVDLISLVRQSVEDKYSRIRHLIDDLRSAWVNDKDSIIKQIDAINVDIHNEICTLESLVEELREEYDKHIFPE